MSRSINNNIDYVTEVAWWTTKFNELMQYYVNAPVAILAYYLRGNSKVVVCPCEVGEIKKYGEEMRNSSVMFAAAEDSGLLAEAIPELFRIALENYKNWREMCNDILFLLQHTHLRRYIPFEYRALAKSAKAANIALFEDEAHWSEFVENARAKLKMRARCGA